MDAIEDILIESGDQWPKERILLQLAQADATAPSSLSVSKPPIPINHERIHNALSVYHRADIGRSAKSLIISTDASTSEKRGELEEDLAIMSRILDKAVEGKKGGDPTSKAMGIVVSTLGGSRGAQNIYLDGYGAIFTLSTRFPLLPSETKTEKVEKVPDNAWEQTRRELYGNVRGEKAEWFHGINQEWEMGAAEYDGAKVEELKNSLIDSLKNGAHIRSLKNNESVVVTVQGPAGSKPTAVVSGDHGSSGRPVPSNRSRGGGGGGNNYSLATDDVRSAKVQRSQSSVMTIQARKSDIDDFAGGKIDLEQFKKKVSSSVY